MTIVSKKNISQGNKRRFKMRNVQNRRNLMNEYRNIMSLLSTADMPARQSALRMRMAAEGVDNAMIGEVVTALSAEIRKASM